MNKIMFNNEWFWVDEHQNRWNCKNNTLEIAQKKSKTLNSCFNTVDCAECFNCSNCYKCFNCCHCLSCGSCLECIECLHCRECKSCHTCNGCYNCTSLSKKLWLNSKQSEKPLEYKQISLFEIMKSIMA